MKKSSSKAKSAKAVSVGKKGSTGHNVGQAQVVSHGLPGSEQDTKRRLGNFTGTGEHARQGGRTSGYVGQSKQQFHTDRPSVPKKPKVARSKVKAAAAKPAAKKTATKKKSSKGSK